MVYYIIIIIIFFHIITPLGESAPARELSSAAWNATESSTLKKLNDFVQFNNNALAKGNKPHHAGVNKI